MHNKEESMQNTPENSPIREENADLKKRKKRRMLTAVIVICAIGLLSGVLLSNPDLFVYTPKEDKITSMYSDKLTSYVFWEPDYDLVVEEDEEYMGLDRYIHLQRGAENFAITDEDYAAWGEEIELFGKYFDAAIHADTETYNSLFTEASYKNNDPLISFATQMIYGITVEKMMEEQMADGSWKYLYNVTYAIHKNNGTFRNDIDSDAYKTLIFILAPENGVLKIDAIDYYRQAG